MKSSLFLLLAASTLGGCATGGMGLANLPNDASMVRNKAVLLTRIEVEVVNGAEPQAPISIGLVPAKAVEHLTPSGKAFTVSSFWRELKPGKNTLAISLAPGAYRWSHVRVGNTNPSYSASLNNTDLFTIEPSATTYVGDAYIRIDWATRKIQWRAFDRYEEAAAAFKSSHPGVAEAFPLIKAREVEISKY